MRSDFYLDLHDDREDGHLNILCITSYQSASFQTVTLFLSEFMYLSAAVTQLNYGLDAK